MKHLVEQLKPLISYYMLSKRLKIKFPDTVWRWYNYDTKPNTKHRIKLENILKELQG